MAGARGVVAGNLSAEFLAVVDETGSLETVLRQVLQFLLHWVVWTARILLRLEHDFGVSSLAQWWNRDQLLHLCDRRGLHYPGDQTKGLVLCSVQGLLVGFCCG